MHGMNAANTPRALQWLGYVALLLLACLPLSVIMVRLGIGGIQPGLLLLFLSCVAAAALLVLMLVLLVLPRLAPHRPAMLKRALLLVPSVLLLTNLLGAREHPAIHDITTDTGNPPAFTAALAQRGPDANPLSIKPDTIARQREGYPDLAPLLTRLSPGLALERAAEVARELGWDVHRLDHEAGELEAVDTTFWMGFKDDIVVRVSHSSGRTHVDLRSASRVGVSDLGANAARIRSFIAQFGD